MKKLLIILIVAAALAAGAWFYFGGADSYTERAIEDQLVQRGVPVPIAACMAVRMTERLSTVQLSKLTRIQPRDGEAAMPANVADFLARVRRIDDPEVVQVTAASAAICTFTAG